MRCPKCQHQNRERSLRCALFRRKVRGRDGAADIGSRDAGRFFRPLFGLWKLQEGELRGIRRFASGGDRPLPSCRPWTSWTQAVLVRLRINSARLCLILPKPMASMTHSARDTFTFIFAKPRM